MQNVVGVRFQEAGKIFYFSPAGFEDVQVAEFVVVETSRGMEIARVVIAPGQVVNAELNETLKPIVRLAYQEDIEQMELLKARAQQDLIRLRRLVAERNLPLTLVSANYNLDGGRLTVYFNPGANDRLDMRDLIRTMQQELGAMVQLRSVGPRDQAKAVGGYGVCGRRLCCSSWLTAFPAISVKLAKDQDLAPNPSKLSGQCGRLLCCLSYENDMYKQLKAEMPRAGSLVSTPAGDARVVGVNALRQVVTLQMANFQVVELPAAALALDRGVVRVIDEPTDEKMAAAFAKIMEPPPAPRVPRPAAGPRRPAPGAATAMPPVAPPAPKATAGPEPASETGLRPIGPAGRDAPDRRGGARPEPPVVPVAVPAIDNQRESVIAAAPLEAESAPAAGGAEAARKKRRRRRGGSKGSPSGGQG